MKLFTIVFTLVLSAVIPLNIAAQSPSPASTPVSPQRQIQIDVRKQSEQQQEFDQIHNLSRKAQEDAAAAARAKKPVNRGSVKKDFTLVAPDAADQTKYADFLKQPNTGLLRLFSDAGCQENSSVTVASDFCIKYQDFFGGSAYSFRTERYRLGRFSDIAYKNGKIYGVGKLTLGLMTDLGENLSPAAVSVNTRGAKYVFDFVPPEDLPNMENFMTQIQKGITSNGFNYQRFYELKENHTYLLRSVAYRKNFETENNKPVFDDISVDKRRDVIVAVQVVRFENSDNPSVTLLWKMLQNKDAPKIRIDNK